VPKKAQSVAQWKLFKAAEAGKARKGGLSQRKAHEMLEGQSSPKGLPKKLTGKAKPIG